MLFHVITLPLPFSGGQKQPFYPHTSLVIFSKPSCRNFPQEQLLKYGFSLVCLELSDPLLPLCCLCVDYTMDTLGTVSFHRPTCPEVNYQASFYSKQNIFQSLSQFCNKCVHLFLVSWHHMNEYMDVRMCIYDCYIYICMYIYMTSILEKKLPSLVPRFYEESMDAICGYNRTFLDLLVRVSISVGTCNKNKSKLKCFKQGKLPYSGRVGW